MKNRRPVFLDLMQIQVPVGSLTSTTHRISGVLRATGIPFGICLLQMSPQDAQGFTRAAGLFDSFQFKAMALVRYRIGARHAHAMRCEGLLPFDIRPYRRNTACPAPISAPVASVAPRLSSTSRGWAAHFGTTASSSGPGR